MAFRTIRDGSATFRIKDTDQREAEVRRLLKRGGKTYRARWKVTTPSIKRPSKSEAMAAYKRFLADDEIRNAIEYADLTDIYVVFGNGVDKNGGRCVTFWTALQEVDVGQPIPYKLYLCFQKARSGYHYVVMEPVTGLAVGGVANSPSAAELSACAKLENVTAEKFAEVITEQLPTAGSHNERRDQYLENLQE